MVNVRNIAASLAFASIFGGVSAHPGDSQEEVRRELEALTAAQPMARRAIEACASHPETEALRSRAVARRAAMAEALRQKRGLTDSEYTHHPPPP